MKNHRCLNKTCMTVQVGISRSRSKSIMAIVGSYSSYTSVIVYVDNQWQYTHHDNLIV